LWHRAPSARGAAALIAHSAIRATRSASLGAARGAASPWSAPPSARVAAALIARTAIRATRSASLGAARGAASPWSARPSTRGAACPWSAPPSVGRRQRFGLRLPPFLRDSHHEC